MKNLVIIALLVLLAWYAWKYYHKEPKVVTNTQIQHVPVATPERYGQALRTLTDNIFAPLDTKAPNPAAELIKLSASAEADLRNGSITAVEAELITRLCSSLKQANREREHYETEYRGILNRRYGSFQGRRGEEATRQFFLHEMLTKWVGTAQSHRRIVESDLAMLRDIERQKEYQGNLRTTPPTVR